MTPIRFWRSALLCASIGTKLLFADDPCNYGKVENKCTVSVSIDAIAEYGATVTGKIAGIKPDDVPDGIRGEIRVGQDTYPITLADHKATFTVTLPLPLDYLDPVQVVLFTLSGTERKNVGFADAKAGSTIVDTGRMKLYFSAGSLWTRTQNAFGSAKPYLSLNIDETWYTTQRPDEHKSDSKSTADDYGDGRVQKRPGEHKSDSKSTYYLVNTFFEARLAQVQFTNPTPSNFLTSQSSAAFEGGVYAPIVPKFTRWRMFRKDHALFVAPIAKIGFNTALSDPPAGAKNSGDVHRYYGGGVRLGYFQPSRKKDVSPTMQSYLDLMVGQWDTIYSTDAKGNPRRPARFDASGRVFVPGTIFYTGFELNVGSGPDDISIFVGTRIDIGSLFGKLVTKP